MCIIMYRERWEFEITVCSLISIDLYHLTGQRDKESAAREQRTEIEKTLKEGERESER